MRVDARRVAARLRRLWGDPRGNVSVLVAAGMVALCGFAAVSLDAGRAFAGRQRLHDVADAAALAGAAYLPDPVAAEEAARDQAAANGVASGISVAIPDARTIVVEASGQTDLFFAPVLDNLLRRLAFRVASRATVSGVRSVRPRPAAGAGGGTGSGTGGGWDLINGGIVPLATAGGPFAYGERVVLKVGPGDGSGGNFYPVALGGGGADAYRENLERGYPQVVRVGDRFDTEPGNMAGPTQQGVRWRIDLEPAATCRTVAPGSPRVVFVPVVDSYAGADGRTQVVVRGFAAFFLEDVAGGVVTGCFLRWVVPGEPGGPDFGLVTVRFQA